MENLKKGSIFALAYVVMMALSVVWVANLHKAFHESFMLLIVSFAAIVIYNIFSLKALKKAYTSIINHPLHWIAMSITFMMTWWLIYFSTIHASPRASIVLFFLALALLGCISCRQIIHAIGCAIAIIISIIILPELHIYTIFSGIFCGVFGYLYMKLSESYAHKNQLQAQQVLAIRFYLLFFTSLFYMIVAHQPILTHLNGNLAWVLLSLIILIIFNLVPNYCVQKSIVLIGTDKFSQISSLTPAVTFLLQGVYQQVWNTNVLILCLAVSVLLNWVSRG